MTIVFEGDKLGMWVVYHQAGIPLPYRARLFCLDQPTTATLGADSLEEIRFLIDRTYPGLVRLQRNEADPPEVVETWL